jgi:hypothetical protein
MLFLVRWRLFIKSDMTTQFNQLPLAKASIFYAAIMTPFKGIRVYTRAAMGVQNIWMS